MHLQRVQHALARDNDLLGLLLHGQRADEGRYLLCRLPLGELPEALLARPRRRVDDLQEQLARARVEHEDGAVDGLGREVALKRLVDGHAVHVGVIHKPDDLVAEQLAVVLGGQVRLRGLGRVQLQALADALAKHKQGGVGLHDLGHGLGQPRLHTREPVAKRAVQVVGKVHCNEHARGGRVDGHVVVRVVQELLPRVALNVVRVVVAPLKLHIDPVLVRRHVKRVLHLRDEGRLGHGPLVRGEQQNVGARAVHLVRLARVDGFLLHRLDLQRVQLLVKHLAQVHNDGLVDLLPQMGAEDLDERDLQRGDLAVHEDAREVQLHLETHVHVGAVDGGGPPQRKAPVGDLVETRPLRVGELLVLHGLLKARRLLPEETLPRGEVRALEQGVLQDALHAAQRLDHVRAVVVQVPQLAVVPLVRPPERVLLQRLVLLEVGADAPPFVVRQRVPVLLEQRVDARDAAVPRVLQILQRETAVLRVGLLALQRVLLPHALRVNELHLPRQDVAIEVGDQLVFLVAQARPEVGHAQVGLLGVAQVGLRDEHVPHGQHAQSAQLLGRVEHHGREAAGHLGVQADLDARLDLVLALHEKVQQLLRVHGGLPEVRHQANERRVPLVDDLGEGGGPRRHEDLAHTVLKLLERLVVHAQKGLRGALLGFLVLQVPHAVPVHVRFLVERADFGQDAHLEAAHVEQQVGVVLAVHRHEAVLPLHRGDGARQAVLDLPEHGAPQVHVVLHEPHAAVARPALLVVVANNVFVVGVGVLREVALDELLGLVVGEAVHDV
mmetsp:Transcript_35305/g.88749  ORF Transcript_35305/g.88749 Transcript_35305/m.88749 type:complete len:781 (-) Transcript_35305:276-2618(-)